MVCRWALCHSREHYSHFFCESWQWDHFLCFQGHPGVSVHLTGRRRAGGWGGPQPAPLCLPFGELQELSAVLQRCDRVAAFGTLRGGVQLRRAAAHCHGAVLSGAGGAGQVRVGIKALRSAQNAHLWRFGLEFAGSRRPKRRSWRGFCSCRSPKSNAVPQPGLLCSWGTCPLKLFTRIKYFFFFFFFFLLNAEMLSYSRYFVFSTWRMNEQAHKSCKCHGRKEEKENVSLVFYWLFFTILMSFMKWWIII